MFSKCYKIQQEINFFDHKFNNWPVLLLHARHGNQATSLLRFSPGLQLFHAVTSSSVHLHLSYFASSTSKHCCLTFFDLLNSLMMHFDLGLQWLPIKLNEIQDTLILGIQCWTSTALIKPHSPCQAATIGHYQLPSSLFLYMTFSLLSRSRFPILVIILIISTT